MSNKGRANSNRNFWEKLNRENFQRTLKDVRKQGRNLKQRGNASLL